MNTKLLKQVAELKKQNEQLLSQNRAKINRMYKDRLFKFLFGNPENKQWTLDLYNALHQTHYTNPEDIHFNTLEDAVNMGMKNDVSFLINFEMIMWEHQSTFSENMPLRFAQYAVRLYDEYIDTFSRASFKTAHLNLPDPEYICFYNGTEDKPDYMDLRLSASFAHARNTELVVRMVNINYGKNAELLNACKPLYEYAWFVDAIRKYQAEKMPISKAIDTALDTMPDDYRIKQFLLKNRTEVKGMMLTEFDEQKFKEQTFEEGMDKGADSAHREDAANMLTKTDLSFASIVNVTGLAEEIVREIAASLNIAIR